MPHWLYNLLFSVINDNSIGKLSEVPLKTSSTKSYLSLVSFFSFPRLNNLELIPFAKALLLHGLNPRPLFYNNYLNQKLFACIFYQRLLFDHKQLCIWPLKLSKHYEPGNHSKNQRLRPLQNSLNVSCTIIAPALLSATYSLNYDRWAHEVDR